MQIMDAIYKRRAVRSFQKTVVSEELLRQLLNAAVHAPSAMNAQPWAFLIVEGKDLLKEYSDRAKGFLLGSLDPESPLHEYRESLADREFNIFYDAGILSSVREIVIRGPRRTAVWRPRISCWRLWTLVWGHAPSVSRGRG